MLERCQRSLVKIHDPEAVHLIREFFPNESWNFKNYTSSVLSDIKHQDSEDAVLALLETEQNPEIRTMLCQCLCASFSEAGVEVVQREILSGYADWIVHLEEMLLPVIHVLGIDLPEADAWRKEREERKVFQAKRRAELEDLGRRHSAAQFRKPRPLSSPFAQGDDLLGSSPEPGRTRAGRNDPCPCGSGKKYKKCCGRRNS
jgi:hypothetical protein